MEGDDRLLASGDDVLDDVLLVHRTEHLERVYADAQRGDARARALFLQLETQVRASGERLAAQALGLGCTSLPACTVREDDREALIPALGAWRGMFLVHTLGGRWVPRRKLEETAVVIGDRAWLPFPRARHALQGREAPLDSSCSQLFRLAQRLARTSSP